jgi:hypothetical protein
LDGGFAMPIDGINNLYRVPTIHKERMPDDERKKKNKKKSNDDKKDVNNKNEKKDGRIDIRI